MYNLLGEFLGTMTLIIFGCGMFTNSMLVRSKGHNAPWLAMTTSWFLAIIMGVFVAKATGSTNADINPAVTLTKFIVSHTYTSQEMAYTMLAQLVGAFVGAIVVWLNYLPHWHATRNTDRKLAALVTTPAIKNIAGNLLSEMIATAVLAFGVAALFTSGQVSANIAPYLVGILVWGIGLSLGGATAFAINPARDLGPRLAHLILPIAGKGSSNWGYAWIPVVGPFVGAIIGAFLWKLTLA